MPLSNGDFSTVRAFAVDCDQHLTVAEQELADSVALILGY